MRSSDCKSEHLILSSLGMFQIDITLFDCSLDGSRHVHENIRRFWAYFRGSGLDLRGLLTSDETMWLPEFLILIEHNPPMLGDLEF
ncbi:hypothetical protein Pyn_22686 [Prunus yedoensis var. nudiflora]|uniref:Uncharacterized protein n=1 Tax=Prunus yedoensis var. nudiflora TaxID=2094558 RepID=A0A314UCL3_PRUYE|nr:hypothetical protein Pyn_22686 [Prunus yedoensis var. nudiflora]